VTARAWLIPLAVLALTAAYPLVFSNPLATQYGFYTALFAAAVVAWNLFSGYSGYISLGHAVFFGTGAYAVGLAALHLGLNTGLQLALLPLGGLAGAAAAVPYGLIALRVRRHTFVVVTIALFFIFQLMAYNFSFTGGTNGLAPPFLNWSQARFNDTFYYLALLLAVVAVALGWLVRGSRFGLQLLAIRDDEDRARGLGVRPMRVKLAALVISAFLTGIAGGLFLLFIGQAYPDTVFDPNYDLSVALMGFLGGFGTVWGPLLGAVILEPLQEYLTLSFPNGYLSLILLGALFLAVILVLPRGLLPTGMERYAALRARWERRHLPAPGGVPSPPEPAPVPPARGAGP
jgi:branched-chain amino acid transport system permease protein